MPEKTESILMAYLRRVAETCPPERGPNWSEAFQAMEAVLQESQALGGDSDAASPEDPRRSADPDAAGAP